MRGQLSLRALSQNEWYAETRIRQEEAEWTFASTAGGEGRAFDRRIDRVGCFNEIESEDWRVISFDVDIDVFEGGRIVEEGPNALIDDQGEEATIGDGSLITDGG